MARHEINLHENTGATKERAPYLGNYIHKGTLFTPEAAERIAALCGKTPISCQAIIKGSFEALARLERECPTFAHTALGTVCCRVLGTFPSADAEFDRTRNAYEPVLMLSEEIRNALANVRPVIVNEDTTTKVRVDNIADLEEPRPYQVIHGQRSAKVTGINLVLSDEGARVFYENAMGTEFPCTVDEVISRQEFTYHSDELLEAGDYKLVVLSRGGDAEGPLQRVYRKVKYLHVLPPPPPGPVLDTLTNLQGRSFTNTDTDGYLNGANFTGATVRAEYGTRLDPSSEELDWSYFSDAEFSYEVEDATKIRIHQLAGYEVSAYAYRYTVATATGEVVKTFE